MVVVPEVPPAVLVGNHQLINSLSVLRMVKIQSLEHLPPLVEELEEALIMLIPPTPLEPVVVVGVVAQDTVTVEHWVVELALVDRAVGVDKVAVNITLVEVVELVLLVQIQLQ